MFQFFLISILLSQTPVKPVENIVPVEVSQESNQLDPVFLTQKVVENLLKEGISLSEKKFLLEISSKNTELKVILRSLKESKFEIINKIQVLSNKSDKIIQNITDRVKIILNDLYVEDVKPKKLKTDSRILDKKRILENINTDKIRNFNSTFLRIYPPVFSTLLGATIFVPFYKAIYEGDDYFTDNYDQNGVFIDRIKVTSPSVLKFGLSTGIFAFSGYMPLFFDEDDFRGDTYFGLLSGVGLSGIIASLTYDIDKGLNSKETIPIYIGSAAVLFRSLVATGISYAHPRCNKSKERDLTNAIFSAKDGDLKERFSAYEKCAFQNKAYEKRVFYQTLPIALGVLTNLGIALKTSESESGLQASSYVSALYLFYFLILDSVPFLLKTPSSVYLDTLEKNNTSFEMSVVPTVGGVSLIGRF